MRVSVIVPTYNRAEKLKRALASVSAQSRGDLELIVVDDASGDDTRDVVESLSDANLRYVRHSSRKGGSAARNTGLRVCQGDYVAFLDSDDEWLPTKIERQLEVFARCSSETGLVYTGAVHVRPGREPAVRTPRYRGSIARQLLTENVVGSASAGMVRRDVLDLVGGFDETLEALQDLDLWLRISERFRIDFVPDILVRIHVHEGAERISNDDHRRVTAREAFYSKHREIFLVEGNAHRYHTKTARLYLRSLRDRRESRRLSRRAIRAKYLSPLGYLSYEIGRAHV